MSERPLKELVHAYRAGDPAAQQEMLQRLETQLRTIVRALIGKQIRTERESMDVCQSLMLAFHLQAQSGKVQLESEEALRAYLRSMIRHKLANLSDRIRAAKRGSGAQPARIHGEDGDILQLPAIDPSASMVASGVESRRTIEDALNGEEKAILAGLLEGRGYAEIAHKLGKQPDAVRMMWNRARRKLIDRGVLKDGS